MLSKSVSARTRGRPTKNDYMQIRAEVFKMVFAKWKDPSAVQLLKYSDVEAALHVDRKTVRAIFQDIADTSADMLLVSEGIRSRRDTYYHSNVPKARDLKDALADEFVRLIPTNVTLACCAGTTVATCVRRLIETGHYHVIVTNNIGVLDQLSSGDISNLVFTGGEYKRGLLKARKLAQDAGQLLVCDSQIGQILSYAPPSSDGSWPCVEVRNLIDEIQSPELENGFQIGKYNQRGVIRRGEGGKQEWDLVKHYRELAEKVRNRWPRTAGILDDLAKGYENEARQWDEQAKRDEFE